MVCMEFIITNLKTSESITREEQSHDLSNVKEGIDEQTDVSMWFKSSGNKSWPIQSSHECWDEY